MEMVIERGEDGEEVAYLVKVDVADGRAQPYARVLGRVVGKYNLKRPFSTVQTVECDEDELDLTDDERDLVNDAVECDERERYSPLQYRRLVASREGCQ